MLRWLCAVLVVRAGATADRPSRSAVRPTVDGAQHPRLLSLLGGSVSDAAQLSDTPMASADRVDEIEAQYRALSGGLNPLVDVALLAQQVCLGLYDGVSQHEVDELMAETAAYQASMHPDFARLAARVAASCLHAQTEPSIVATLRALHAHTDPVGGGHAPLVSAELLALAEELAPVVEPALRHERDFDFDYFGLRTLQRSYLLGDGDKARERPQHMLMRVALCVHGRDAPAVLEARQLTPCPCRAHAVPMPCPCRAHAVPMPCTHRAPPMRMPRTRRAHTVAHTTPCTHRARTVHTPCIHRAYTVHPETHAMARQAYDLLSRRLFTHCVMHYAMHFAMHYVMH